ncbi:PAX-interacting protein 1-like protein [Leptotrombidium deliense]|uniref:PAX-interacting protein 1 n=1 Tax=Leptotrombidium deliense TaxID=299467 RepID=A0A443SUG4_9ACAR|nr:PAX-interacting protein 1-like protein [Leptotrombidium deliense]
MFNNTGCISDGQADSKSVKSGLFVGVQFCLCEDVDNIEEVKKILVEGGGKHVNYLSDIVTHLIADNAEHQDVSEAVEIFEKTVVSSRWVWSCANANALLPTNAFSPLKTQLFSNIVVCVSNVSPQDADSLWAMITYNGGTFQLHLDVKCTHLIATKPEGSKYDKALATCDRIKIVTPDWVIDSVKSKTRCDEELYHPRLLILPNSRSEILTGNDCGSSKTTINEANDNALVAIPTAQVTLRTVSLPPSTIITTLPITHTSVPQVTGPRRQIRVFLPPQRLPMMQIQQNRAQLQQVRTQLCSNTVTAAETQQLMQSNSEEQEKFLKQMQHLPNTNISQSVAVTTQQPRHVYLALQQQPHIRQQQLSFIHIRQQQLLSLQQTQQNQNSEFQSHDNQQAANELSQEVQIPMKPPNVILQQRIQPPVQLQQIGQSQPQQQIQQGQVIVPINQHQQTPQTISSTQQPIRMLQGQPFIQLQRPLQQTHLQQQCQTSIRTPQQIVFHQNQIMQQSLQRPQIQTLQQIYSQHQQQTNPLSHPQVPRVPQLRVQPSYQIQRTQQRSQIPTSLSGQRVFMKPPPQYPFQQISDGISQPNRQQSPQQRLTWSPQETQAITNQTQLVRPPQMVASPSVSSGTQVLQWQQQELAKKHLTNQQPTVRLLQSTQRLQFPLGSSDQVRQPSSTPSTTRTLQSAATVTNVLSTMPSQVTAVGTSTCCVTSTTCAIVTPKTKTALANLLNTRLQNNAFGGGVHKISNDVNTTGATINGSQVSSHSGDGSSAPVTAVASDAPFSLVNKLSSVGSQAVSVSNVDHSKAHLEPQEKFFGYEPKVTLPAELCLVGCTFCIVEYESCSFKMDSSMRKMCKKVIAEHGGEFEETYTSKCTHVICETQQNSVVQQTSVTHCTRSACPIRICETMKALKDGKRVITIFWLEDVLELKKLKPPWKGWHLPKSFSSDKAPCESHIITTTNFTEDERSQIKLICKLVGAKYTSYMCNKNTILICKSMIMTLDLHTVTYIILEGKKFRKAVEWGLIIVNLQWLHDILLTSNPNEILSAVDVHKYKKFDLKDHFEFNISIVRHLMTAWKSPISLPNDLPSRIANLKVIVKPSTANPTVEDQSCIVKPSELQAKEIDVNVDVEKSLTKEPIGQPPLKKLKVASSDEELLSTVTMNRLPPPPPLMPAPYLSSSNPENCRIKVMFTGLGQQQVEIFKQIVIKLGARVTSNYLECTHLVVSGVKRTVKFLCSFNYADYILTQKWIEDSEKQNQLLNENGYWIDDANGEEHFKFSVRDSLERRKERACLLFKDHVFYITKSCIPSPKLLTQIVSSAGGLTTEKPPNSGQLNSMKKRDQNFVVITCPDDIHLCDRFFFNKILVNISCTMFIVTAVVNTEFIMSNVLKQELDYSSYEFEKKIS